MKMPDINPHVDVIDKSAVDESIKQTSSPIYNTGTINQNCGNQKEMTRLKSTMISVICDLVIIILMVIGFQYVTDKFSAKLENITSAAQLTHNDIRRETKLQTDILLKQNKDEMTLLIKEARTTNIWTLRHDILRTIDLHTAKKTITHSQYVYLKEEYDHYREIGGNHDVKEKFDAFTSKIFGTGTIKMIDG